MDFKRTPLPCIAQRVDYRIIVKSCGCYTAAENSTGVELPVTQIGPYAILRLVGTGSSSLVYHALDTETGHIVCLKEIYPEALANQLRRVGVRLCPAEDFSQDKLRKQIEYYLGKENVISECLRYTVGVNGITNDGHFLQTTEVNPGFETLARYLRIDTQAGEPLSRARWDKSLSKQERVLDMLKVIRRIAETLQVFHRKGFLHLDLKPENIFVSHLIQNEKNRLGNHYMFLLDYGSSVPLNDKGHIAEDARLSATQFYAAQEVKDYLRCQAEGDIDTITQLREYISYSSDTFSLVKILFQFLLEDTPESINGYRIDSVRKNPDVATLPAPVQEEIISFLKHGMAILPDKRFQSVDELLQALDKVIRRVQEKYCLVPKAPSAIAKDKFLGRVEQLRQLDELLRNNDLVFISGVGGVGKSELAAQYARSQTGKLVVHSTYSPGSDKEEADKIERSGIRQLLLNLAITNYPLPPEPPKNDALSMQTRPQRDYSQERQAYYDGKIKKLREICDENTLLIIDNFNVPDDEGLRELASLRCKVILTTWCDYGMMNYAQLVLENTVADEAWAVKLFTSQCRKKNMKWDIVREIVRTVEYHTTAVILLGAQMQSDHMDEEVLLQSLKEGLEKVGQCKVPFRKDGLNRTDQKSFGYLQAIFDMSALSDKERQLLIRISFLSAQPFTIEMLKAWEPELDMDILNRLVHFRWIIEDAEDWDMLRMPQVISDVFFESAGEEVLEGLEFVQRFADWYDSLPNSEQCLYLGLLEAVAEQLCRIPEEVYEKSEDFSAVEVWSEIVHKYACFLRNHNRHNLAAQVLKQIIQKSKNLDKPSVLADAKYLLACVLYKVNEIEEAKRCHEDALHIRASLKENDSPEELLKYAQSCNQLGYLMYRTCHFDEAEKYYSDAISVQTELQDDYRVEQKKVLRDCALTLNNLAVLYEKNHKEDDAETMHKKALKIRKRLAEDESVEALGYLAMSYLNYAKFLAGRSGGAIEAADYFVKAINLYDTISKKDLKHLVDSAIAGYYYACFMERQDKYEALKLHKKVLQRRFELSIDNREALLSDLADSYYAVGRVQHDLGNHIEANGMLDKAITIKRKLVQTAPEKYGEEFEDILQYINSL